MMGIFYNQGQVCCAGSRLFVEESVKDQFLDKLSRRRQDRVGDPMDKTTQMGPQVSEEQLNRIKVTSISRVKKARRVPVASRRSSKARFRKVTSSVPRSFRK
jgi:acyl-CoA reductase-like NAD-dependent aldehyde dehydrogenase